MSIFASGLFGLKKKQTEQNEINKFINISNFNFMKLYRVLTLAVVTALCASFFSCSDDDDDDDNFVTTYLPKTIVGKQGSNENTYTFSYDSQNRLTGWESRYEKNTITYGTDGKITKLYTEEGENYTSTRYYTYKGNEVTVTDEDGGIDEIININGNGCVTSISYDDDASEKLSYSGKNITRSEYKEEYEEGTYEYKSSIKYDGKAGIFRNVNTPQWFIYTQMDENFGATVGNNFASSDSKGYIEGVEVYKETTTNTFAYNDEKYPTSITSVNKWEDLIDFDGVAPKVAKRNKKATKSVDAKDSGTETTTYTISYDVKK